MLEKLYKKKVIRSFLSLYSEKYWTQLVSHILEYGIILFKKKYTVSALSPEDICQIVEGLKKDEHIYDNIKTLKKAGNSKSSRQSSLSKGKGNSLSKAKASFSGSTNRMRNGSVSSQSSSTKKGITGDTHSKKNIHNIRKAQTPSRQRSTDMFKFKANAGGNGNSNSNSKYKTNFQSSSNSNSSKNIKTQSFMQQRTKSKTRTSKGSNELLGHNNSNASSRKTILSMTQTSNLESNHNKNNTSIISAYSCYTTDINNNNNNSSTNNMMTIKHKQGNAFQSTHLSTSINNNKHNNSSTVSADDNKLIHFGNSNNDFNKQAKPKAESKIKALIENDKKKYMQQQKYTNLSGTLRPLSTENSNIDMGEVNYVVTEKPIIDNLNTNTNPIKEDEYDEHNNNIKSKTNYPIKNESSIISLEDKLNGLTMKLSKLNASINNNNSTLQSLQPLSNTSHQLMNNANSNVIPSSATSSYPSYLKSGINYRLDNLELNIGSTPLHTNQFINTTEGNNDEDYLGEDQIDLVGGSRTGGLNLPEESNGDMEMRCYRKTQEGNH